MSSRGGWWRWSQVQNMSAFKADPPLIYEVRLELTNDNVRSKYKALEMDEETATFVANCQPSALKDGMATMLRTFMSRTDANGITGRGHMFVLSKQQLQGLCGPQSLQGRLLDIGSGDGSITERYAECFQEVVTTETSTVMAKKLRGRGWVCYEPPEQEIPLPRTDAERFDLITCLNVLDRCDKPVTLLESFKAQLKPETGRLVLAVVLPWCPFVEDGTKQRQPSEILEEMKGRSCKDRATFEASLCGLVEVVEKCGFEIVSISRVPYISEGDQNQRYYVLSDSILVCKVSKQ